MKDEDFTSLMRERWEGFTGFSIKAKDTEANRAIHDAFREFCEVEANKDYTIGLKLLLEAIRQDYKYEVMFDRLVHIEQKLKEMEVKPEPKKEQKEGGLF